MSKEQAALCWEEYASACEYWAEYLDKRGEGGETYRNQARNAREAAAQLRGLHATT